MKMLDAEDRPATPSEQKVIAGWSSWGAVANVFDERKTDWAGERDELKSLLTEKEWEAASDTVLNAHYTSPAIVNAMWGAVGRLGMDRGQVLEPGCGSGNFIGLAPAGMEMTGVEIDPLTAAIAGRLYPDATVRNEGFQDTRIVPGAWDAAVGNVPFSDIRLVDKAWNQDRRFVTHDHFIYKAVQGLHPGGVSVVMSSMGTMDKQSPAFRAQMAQDADFLGAVRLPTGAHQRTAGTDAVTDVLMFRKREPGAEPTEATRQFVYTSPVEVTKERTGETFERNVNNYFLDNPENVLGSYDVGGQFNRLTVTSGMDDAAIAAALDERLTAIAQTAVDAGLGYVGGSDVEGPGIVETSEQIVWDGTVVADGEGFSRVKAGELEPIRTFKKDAAEITSLLALRDEATQLVQMQLATPAETDEIIEARQRAHDVWAGHVERFGPVNRYTTRWVNKTERNEETGVKETIRQEVRAVPSASLAMRSDPNWGLTLGMERFNEETQEANPADILLERTVFQERPVLGADTPEAALRLTIEQTGGIDIAHVAALLGSDEERARADLGDLVYSDPVRDELVTAKEYLSGNVRAKLDEARAAYAEDPNAGWETNVQALEGALPADVPLEDIEAVPGAVWITTDDHEQFIRELVRNSKATVNNPASGIWEVRVGDGGYRSQTLERSEWGTERRSAYELFEALATGREITVRDEEEKGKFVVNPEATEAAREKAELIAERFAEWAWEDPERAARLHQEYNRRFNSLVMRDYTEEGEHLSLPGLNPGFTPHPHQRTAVARMINEPTVGLFHEVGAGKTAVMVMGLTELKRRGLVNKPVVVVPNHMLEQFTREWTDLYPTAKLLSADSDTLKGASSSDPTARRQFAGQVAANDWDAVIMTGDAFKKIGVSEETREAYIDEQCAEITYAIRALEAESDGSAASFKRLKARAKSMQESLKSRIPDNSDGGLTFEQMGIDYMAVDEAHLYKNLQTFSSIPGAAIDGSQQAQDMHMKMSYLRSRHGSRVGTFATGTPIANSVTEAHVMMRYLRPDLLEEQGVGTFDQWGKTFGQVVSKLEPDAGGRLRTKSRLSKFKNVPEMLGTWHQFADTALTSEMEYLTLPDIAVNADGERRPEMVIIERSPELAAYMDDLVKRLDNLKGKRAVKGEDNHLSVYSDGRMAALDMRMVGGAPADYGKVDVVSARVASTWEKVRDNEYPTPGTDDLSAKKGGLQLVFCDLSTPNDERWDFYNQLKSNLVTGYGMDAGRIAFIHDAKNAEEKAELFRKAREGDLDVLVGSSQKMGTGANIQLRAAALHHVDCPWRPAELTQREGRILRQGNANPEVEILRYATEKSFDSTQWDTIHRKALASAQIMRGTFDAREMDDPGDLALDAQQLMAASSGNHLLVRKVELETLVEKLARRERGFEKSKTAMQFRVASAMERISAFDEDRPIMQRIVDTEVDTRGDKFRMTVAGVEYTKRTEALPAVIAVLRRPYDWADGQVFGEIGGQKLTFENASSYGEGPMLAVHVGEDPIERTTVYMSYEAVRGTPNAWPNVPLMVENKIRSMPDRISAMDAERQSLVGEIETAKAAIDKPFKAKAELEAARRELNQVTMELTAQDAEVARQEADGPVAETQETGEDTSFAATVVDQVQQVDGATVTTNVPIPAETVEQPAGDSHESPAVLRAARRDTVTEGVLTVLRAPGRVDGPTLTPMESRTLNAAYRETQNNPAEPILQERFADEARDLGLSVEDATLAVFIHRATTLRTAYEKYVEAPSESRRKVVRIRAEGQGLNPDMIWAGLEEIRQGRAAGTSSVVEGPDASATVEPAGSEPAAEPALAAPEATPAAPPVSNETPGARSAVAQSVMDVETNAVLSMLGQPAREPIGLDEEAVDVLAGMYRKVLAEPEDGDHQVRMVEECRRRGVTVAQVQAELRARAANALTRAYRDAADRPESVRQDAVMQVAAGAGLDAERVWADVQVSQMGQLDADPVQQPEGTTVTVEDLAEVAGAGVARDQDLVEVVRGNSRSDLVTASVIQQGIEDAVYQAAADGVEVNGKTLTDENISTVLESSEDMDALTGAVVDRVKNDVADYESACAKVGLDPEKLTRVREATTEWLEFQGMDEHQAQKAAITAAGVDADEVLAAWKGGDTTSGAWTQNIGEGLAEQYAKAGDAPAEREKFERLCVIAGKLPARVEEQLAVENPAPAAEGLVATDDPMADMRRAYEAMGQGRIGREEFGPWCESAGVKPAVAMSVLDGPPDGGLPGITEGLRGVDAEVRAAVSQGIGDREQAVARMLQACEIVGVDPQTAAAQLQRERVDARRAAEGYTVTQATLVPTRSGVQAVDVEATDYDRHGKRAESKPGQDDMMSSHFQVIPVAMPSPAPGPEVG